jgi:hypothetical protein
MEQESLEGDALDDLLLNIKGVVSTDAAASAGAGAGQS